MEKKYFITGTDTNVGKTTASIFLLKIAKKLGYTAIGYKPFAAGCKKTRFGLRNKDAILLKKYSTINLSYEKINPYAYEFFSPPSFFLKKNKMKDKHFKKMSIGLIELSKKANWILIEGAGGWHTPLSLHFNYSNWVIEEKLNVILVVGIKMGCINHAILTSEAIKKSGLNLSGWIANHIDNKTRNSFLYVDYIKNIISSPFLGTIPYIKNKKKRHDFKSNLILPDM
ncbi:dethiobiotin synthase [Buchnera aphidicola (Mindarus keteleerifoliae)]|uniref:dethiobiotin synthase n=1 Tax=Buchnera aphidicola TaxID=9 RepID=UPI0031B67FE3